jgi:hypothetical protein
MRGAGRLFKEAKMNKKELLKLPYRKWDEIKEYNSIVIIPSGKKHPSGWMIMCVIGCDEDRCPIEIVACCDDISWIIPNNINEWDFRNDMYYPSGIIRYWSDEYNFQVGVSFISTLITLVKKVVL